MSSVELHGRPRIGMLAWLLDPVLGFLLWAAHLLLVYIATAVACVLGLGAAGVAAQSMFSIVLGLVTALAAALLLLHGLLRFRQYRAAAERRFRLAMTLGVDALA